MDGASKSVLQDEFGSDKDEDCMVKILEGGEHQAVTVSWEINKEMSLLGLAYTNNIPLGPRT